MEFLVVFEERLEEVNELLGGEEAEGAAGKVAVDLVEGPREELPQDAEAKPPRAELPIAAVLAAVALSTLALRAVNLIEICKPSKIDRNSYGQT